MTATGDAGYMSSLRCICDPPCHGAGWHRVPIECSTPETRAAAERYSAGYLAREAERARVYAINRATWVLEKLARSGEVALDQVLWEIYDQHQAELEDR